MFQFSGLILQSCATYSEINDKMPSVFGTLVFLTRDFTLDDESKLGLQDEQFSDAVSKIKVTHLSWSGRKLIKSLL